MTLGVYVVFEAWKWFRDTQIQNILHMEEGAGEFFSDHNIIKKYFLGFTRKWVHAQYLPRNKHNSASKIRQEVRSAPQCGSLNCNFFNAIVVKKMT